VLSKELTGGYKVLKSLGTDKSINSHYLGKIWATGGAIADLNKYIPKMDPLDIGTLKPNELTINGDDSHKKEIFSFRKIKCYTDSLNQDTFNVYSMKAKKENYHIIIELRKGPHYDRIINIYKEQQPYMMILWKETLRIKPKKKIGI
jgi:hypothetical protein